MKRATLPATAALVALTVIAARADDPAATAPAVPGPGKSTSGPSSTAPPASTGPKRNSGSDEPGNFGSGLDRGVGSGAGSTGMRGEGK